MSEDTRGTPRGRLGQVLAFARSAEPRAVLPRRAVITDIVIAVLVLAAALIAVWSSYANMAGRQIIDAVTGQVLISAPATRAVAGIPWPALVAAIVTSVPLATRRLYPLATFAALLLGVLATRRYATDLTFLVVVFAAYSAVAHSRFRGGALLGLVVAAVAVPAAFWTSTSAGPAAAAGRLTRSLPLRPQPPPPALKNHVLSFVSPYDQWRGMALLLLVSLVTIAIVGYAVHAREARARLQAEHEADKRRAVEQERARIASELHDVVTHNVSVMIVQAGAARQVLAEAPEDARAALLAVEASGRAAMTELRHLLGLLSPSAAAPGEGAGAGASGTQAEEDLRPQPGLGQLRPLIDRVTAAGLPIDLQVGRVPPGLPPGLDLAAFRVVQEALTNVLKHAGKPSTSVRLDCRDGDLVVEVADAGRPVPAVGPAVPGCGRGLLGLRERTALYGGELEAGPRPGGGWLVRASMPVDPLSPGAGPAALAAQHR